MLKSFRKTQPVYVAVDLVLITACFFVPYFLRYNYPVMLSMGRYLPYFTEHLFIFCLQAFLIVTTFKRKRLYGTLRDITVPRELTNVVTRLLYVAVIVGSVIFFARFHFFSRLFFLSNFMLLCAVLGGWRLVKRLVLRKLIREGFRNINTLIVGAGKAGRMILEEIEKRPSLGFRVVGFLDDRAQEEPGGLPVLGTPADFESVAAKHFIDEVVVAIPHDRAAAAEIVRRAQQMRVAVRVVPDHIEEPLAILDTGSIGMIPLLTYKERWQHPSEIPYKRLFDVAASAVSLVLLAPVFAVIAVLVKLDSPGPVFFAQKRTGLKARPFDFYKFRSMVKEAEQLKPHLRDKNEIADGVIFKIRNDPRVTKIGRFLRRYSLDELPQLFNVLKGDMSLVGPRPPLPGEVSEYEDTHMGRLSIRPGITGLSQIRGRSDLSFSRWVKWDLWYVNHWSLWLDLKIIWWTIPVVLKGKGAY
jgi:exopolysaccharide biosynthesis polyprenyl glycosylphosphotransferase